MAFGQTPKDAGGLPVSAVYIPGTGFVALQGSAKTNTDASSNASSPACFARFAATVYSLAAGTVLTTSSNSGDQTVGPFDELALDINITAVSGTSPTIQFIFERKGADGVYYSIWPSSVINTVQSITASIGVGAPVNHSFGSIARLRWVVTGTTPSFTMSASLIGK